MHTLFHRDTSLLTPLDRLNMIFIILGDTNPELRETAVEAYISTIRRDVENVFTNTKNSGDVVSPLVDLCIDQTDEFYRHQHELFVLQLRMSMLKPSKVDNGRPIGRVIKLEDSFDLSDLSSNKAELEKEEIKTRLEYTRSIFKLEYHNLVQPVLEKLRKEGVTTIYMHNKDIDMIASIYGIEQCTATGRYKPATYANISSGYVNIAQNFTINVNNNRNIAIHWNLAERAKLLENAQQQPQFLMQEQQWFQQHKPPVPQPKHMVFGYR